MDAPADSLSQPPHFTGFPVRVPGVAGAYGAGHSVSMSGVGPAPSTSHMAAPAAQGRVGSDSGTPVASTSVPGVQVWNGLQPGPAAQTGTRMRLAHSQSLSYRHSSPSGWDAGWQPGAQDAPPSNMNRYTSEGAHHSDYGGGEVRGGAKKNRNNKEYHAES